MIFIAIYINKTNERIVAVATGGVSYITVILICIHYNHIQPLKV